MEKSVLSFHEMDFVKTLVANGTSLEVALALVGKGVADKPTYTKVVSSKKVDTKVSKAVDLDKKSKSVSTHSKVASNKSDSKVKNLKVGNYVKVINLKDKSKIVNFGKITKIEKGYAYLNGAKKTSYNLKNCRRITKQEFGKMKKSSKKTSTVAISNNSKRLPPYYYAMAMAYAIDKIDTSLDMLKQVKATAVNDTKRLNEIIKDMRSRNLIKDFGANSATAILKENSVSVDTKSTESRFNA